MTSLLSTAASTAHAAAVSLLGGSPISVGGSLPAAHTELGKTASIPLKENAPEPNAALDLATLFGPDSGRIVLVGVPGAFTPACSSQVPGYIENEEAFRAKGINQIYVVAVNDAFVVKAWKEKLTAGKSTSIRFLADDSGAFTAKLGMLFDATPLLGGPRSKRFALVAEGGKVIHVALETDPSNVDATSAEKVLAFI